MKKEQLVENAALDLLNEVARKYDLNQSSDFSCPHMRKLAEHLGWQADSKDEVEPPIFREGDRVYLLHLLKSDTIYGAYPGKIEKVYYPESVQGVGTVATFKVSHPLIGENSGFIAHAPDLLTYQDAVEFVNETHNEVLNRLKTYRPAPLSRNSNEGENG